MNADKNFFPSSHKKIATKKNKQNYDGLGEQMNTTDKINLENLILMRDNLRKTQQNYEQIVKDQGKEVFLEAAKQIFQTNPNLEHFSWNQYTPYFNDGDECKFSVNYAWVSIKTTNMEDGARDLRIYDQYRWSDPDFKWKPTLENFGVSSYEELQQIAKSIQEVMQIFYYDDYKMMFGDHAKITVFRDGDIDIDSYDHD